MTTITLSKGGKKVFYNICAVLILYLTVISSFTLLANGGDSSPVSDNFRAAYRYLGNSASDHERNGWFHELQGIANSKTHWYFSGNEKPVVFRAPYTHPDHSQNLDKKFVIGSTWRPMAPLFGKKCTHLGDLDVHYWRNKQYIIVGLDDDNIGKKGFIIFLRGRDMSFAGYLDIRDYQKGVPWVAAHGPYVYSSKGGKNVKKIHRYKIDWKSIPARGGREVKLDKNNPHNTYPVTGINYSKFQDNMLHHVQGGDFSTDGKLFFAAVGYCARQGKRLKWKCSLRAIIVLRVTDSKWPVIRISSQGERPFRFQSEGFDQEPQGISYYDINDSGSPHSGELHAINLNNDNKYDKDNVWIKHYTSIIEIESGDSIEEALGKAWDGSILALEKGNYSENLKIKSRVNGSRRNIKLVSAGGVVRIKSH